MFAKNQGTYCVFIADNLKFYIGKEIASVVSFGDLKNSLL